MFLLVGGFELCLDLELCLTYILLFVSIWLHILHLIKRQNPAARARFTAPGEGLDSEALNCSTPGEAIRKRAR
jgi:hypothetical protein